MPPGQISVLLAAHDAASDRAFNQLAPVLHRRGHRVLTHLLDRGNIPVPSATTVRNSVAQADIVLIGMSTPKENAIVELRASSEAVAQGKPFGFYVDTHGAFTRRHFAPYRTKAHFLFTLSDDESRRATKVFPQAQAYKTGNPLWESFFKPASYADARRLVDADARHYVILVPGTKDQQHNLIGLDAVIEATKHLKNVRIVFTLHPGDMNDRAPYQARLARAAVGFGDQRMIIVDGKAGDTRKTDEILPGVDLVVNGTSARTHAIARRIPQIDYFTGYSQDWLEKDIGSRYGYFYGSGAVIDVYGGTWEDLAAAITSIRSSPNQLREKQSNLLEQITAAQVLDAMCSALEDEVARQRAR